MFCCGFCGLERGGLMADKAKKSNGKLKKGKKISLGKIAKPQKQIELKVSQGDFTITKLVDKSTPTLH
jgi:type VI protein secretion system component Hcp